MNQGFSFIELMVVLTIIGVLTGLAVPGYKIYVKRSHVSKMESSLRAAQQELKILVDLNGGVLPTDSLVVGAPTIAAQMAQYIDLAYVTGTIYDPSNFKLCVIGNGLMDTKTLCIKFDSSGKELGCGSWDTNSVEDKYLPYNCKAINLGS